MNENKDWDPDNDEYDDEIDAPESLKEMNNTDAQALLSNYVEGLLEGYRSLEANLSSLVDGMRQSGDNPESPRPIEGACVIIRFISSIRKNCPQYETVDIIDLSWFGKDAKSKLHDFLSKGVARKALRNFGKDLSRRKWAAEVSFNALWEVQSMNEIGADVWSRDASDTLKRTVAEAIWKELEASLTAAEKQINGAPKPADDMPKEGEEGENVGEDPPDAAHEAPDPLSREQVLQTYFDATYLDNALRTVRSREVAIDDKHKDTTLEIALSWEFIERTQEKVSNCIHYI
ncbi:hypothetical protein ABW20_dc0104392 [Dactylellina cionopaga]|nr:hypothetical protein ABW20_dc0104392 [Dactylellina cionopaga]